MDSKEIVRMNLKNLLFPVIVFFFLSACSGPDKNEPLEAELFHNSMKELTDIIVHDIFSPPVASRNYVYPSIAAYEVIAQGDPSFNSLAGQLHELSGTPKPPEGQTINYEAAALVAFTELAKELVFSADKIAVSEEKVLEAIQQKVTGKTYKNSVAYGEKVAEHIKTWMGNDNYAQSRTFPKFTVDYDEESRWQPTPPAYMEGIEPHWNRIRTLVIDSAQQFKPIGHPEFSLDKNSEFYKELMEVYEIRNSMQAESEEEAIAQFWDCNPYVSIQKGHFMYAVKKITPGGHWVNITRVACEKDGADFNKSVAAYTKTNIALFDAFISCWDAKYQTNLIRPETLINKHIDEDWLPVLQTPPFPEYTSGHSVISTAAATALTSVFGNDFAFDDTTEEEFGLPTRSFTSFLDASQEAAMSRLYGGIHYRSAIDHGVDQGKELGQLVVNRLQMIQENTDPVQAKR